MAEIIPEEMETEIAATETVADMQVDPVPEEPKSDIPKHLQGLPYEELAKKYTNLEKEKSRLGNDLGELRKLTDDFLRAQVENKPPVVEPEVDFFEDPNAAVERAINNHPKVRELEMMTRAAKQAEAQNSFKSKHPDYTDVLQEPNFAEWVKNSKVRMELFARANNYDVDAADELFTIYKERRQHTAAATQVRSDELESQTKAARVSAGGSVDSPRKIFRRSDLIRLRMNDPDRYEAMSDEIMKAYSEGRVK